LRQLGLPGSIGGSLLFPFVLFEWQKELNDRAMTAVALGASNFEVPRVTVDKVLAYPQSKPGAHHSLGCVERLEDLGKYVRWHPAACISNRQQNPIDARAPVLCLSTAEQKAALPWRGIDRISDQVTQNLPNVFFEHVGGPVRPVSSFDDQADIFDFPSTSERTPAKSSEQ
jgi:hypothetical protein